MAKQGTVEASVSYRYSHVRMGADYDNALARDPFDAFMARQEPELVRRIVQQLFPHGLDRSLDFACGTGRISQILDGIAKHPFGVDVSSTMVMQARPKCPHTSFVIQDITEVPLDIEPVQLVTAFRFFGKAEADLRMAALKAIRRCIAPGGYLILNSHLNPWSVHELLKCFLGVRSPMDLHYWKLRHLLRSCGFRVMHSYGVGFWLYRTRLIRSEVLESRLADTLERVSRLRILAPFSPDAVIVAQRDY